MMKYKLLPYFMLLRNFRTDYYWLELLNIFIFIAMVTAIYWIEEASKQKWGMKLFVMLPMLAIAVWFIGRVRVQLDFIISYSKADDNFFHLEPSLIMILGAWVIFVLFILLVKGYKYFILPKLLKLNE